ncbi:DUF4352 domain-containing protein [Streptomyces sp. NPDC091212]|uniref:DUF4352 domain-containing protein n=1 Tax=Streptomyces sp. NPDC091212 TaxID=3155191 RepID=UPI003415044D
MRSFVRRAAVFAVPVIVASVLVTGCSSEPEAAKPAATKAAVEKAVEPAEAPEKPSPSTSAGPLLTVGQTGTYDVVETDEYGENPTVTTKMQVTVKSAKYVTSADVDTTNDPELGQYVILTLTLKNIGSKPADVSMYGVTTWEDDSTAAQDATTLESVDGPELDATYKPGQSVTGSLVLDVGAKGGIISYDGDTFRVALPTS